MRRFFPAFFALLLIGCEVESSDLRLVGTVEWTSVELTAPVSEAIVEVAVERGDAVSPGDVLVRLDSTMAAAERERAQAARAAALASASLAKQELQRLVQLRRGKVASEQDLDRARRARDEAVARLHEAEARLVAANKRYQDLTLVSPVAGVVDQIPFDTGERVPIGAVLIVVLKREDPWVRVWIPETSFAWVGPGTAALIHIDGLSTVLEGSVLDVAREPEFTPHYALTERDRVHLVYEARVRILHAPASLRPGLPADVRIFPPAPAPTAGPTSP